MITLLVERVFNTKLTIIWLIIDFSHFILRQRKLLFAIFYPCFETLLGQICFTMGSLRILRFTWTAFSVGEVVRIYSNYMYIFCVHSARELCPKITLRNFCQPIRLIHSLRCCQSFWNSRVNSEFKRSIDSRKLPRSKEAPFCRRFLITKFV